ncbi:MAG: chorismate mutase [Sandaracinaceae bacterium]|nr:chorismate mutase [Sandaracinaceae bacterium]
MSSSPMDHLAALRARIDETDRAIVALLARRRAIVEEMRVLKATHALPRIDAAREAEMRAALVTEAARLGVPEALVLAVLEAILADSRALVATQSTTSGDS